MTPLWSCCSFFDGLKAMNELKYCARLVKSYLGSSKRNPPLTWSSKWKTWLRASHLPSRKLTKLWKSMCFSVGNDPWPCAAWKLDPCWGLISFIWGGAECHETLPCVCVCVTCSWDKPVGLVVIAHISPYMCSIECHFEHVLSWLGSQTWQISRSRLLGDSTQSTFLPCS